MKQAHRLRRYPKDWEEIAWSVKQAAKWRCQHCQRHCPQRTQGNCFSRSEWAKTVLSWEHQGDLGAPAGTPVALSGRVLAYLNSHPEVRFEPEELVHEFSGSSKDAIRKVLERHRKKGLIKSEERIKQREAGAVRYKVYYYPGKLSSEDLDTPQNHAGHSESSLDNFDSSLDKSQKRVQRVQRAKPMPSSDSVSLDNSSQVDGNIFYPDLPPIGSTVKVSCPGSKYDGMEAKLTEISPDDDSVYCNIRIEEGQYQGHELNFRPEFIVW